MRKSHDIVYRFILIVLDSLALISAFTVAYILRITLDPRPFYIQIGAIEFITSVLVTLPLWIALLYSFRLYHRKVYTHPLRESGRLLLVSVFGVMIIISFSFFTGIPLFPTKLVALYAMIASFLILLTFRIVVNLIRLRLLTKKIGVKNVLIIGNTPLSGSLSQFIAENPTTGFNLVGIVSKTKFIPSSLRPLRVSSLNSALTRLPIDAIIQTDSVDLEKNYSIAGKHYLDFYQAPTFDALFTAKHSIEILDASPIIKIHATPLIGYGRIVKRLMDMSLGAIGLIIASPIMLIIALAIKITDPKGPVFMHGKMRKRLTRYNKPFNVYKFRSHYAKFDGKTDEEVFKMVGKPELIKEYRAKGDKLDHDFRVTPVGRFIRRFSLDELPQLINVVKGDISLVGPRALVPHELSLYDKKHTLLAVKSGLTGLAAVSGRRNISFDERRRLDLYYVQNWSLWLDISIILRTFSTVLKKDS